MSTRAKFGALAGALLFTLAIASSAFAAAPEYSVSITKTANPTSVAAAGASVTYTVSVTNTGTGFFKVVNVSDDKCTLSAPTGNPDDGDSKFESGETWWYTCTVAGVKPGTKNTASVNACHDGSVDSCNNSNHDATATASVTIGTVAAPAATPTPTPKPAAATVKATQANTAMVDTATSGDNVWLMVIALGVLLASVVILTPARAKNRS
jgi:hypothetical protein